MNKKKIDFNKMTVKAYFDCFKNELDTAESRGKRLRVEEVLEILDSFREKHVHPRQPKLDYYDRWQTSGCNMCRINRLIKKIKIKIKEIKS